MALVEVSRPESGGIRVDERAAGVIRAMWETFDPDFIGVVLLPGDILEINFISRVDRDEFVNRANHTGVTAEDRGKNTYAILPIALAPEIEAHLRAR